MLDVLPIGLLNVLDQLDNGIIELALSSLVEGGDRSKCVRLLEDEYSVVLPSDRPDAAPSELSVEQFAALPHISITSSADDAHFIDEALAELGLAGLISAKVPLHLLVSSLVGSRALAVLPRRVAAGLAAYAPLTIRVLPLASPRIELSIIWHRRVDNHPAHRWLQATLRSVTNPST